jgi:PleD family two-component response regulator
LNDFVEKADSLLYLAKAEGRNQVRYIWRIKGENTKD